MDANTGCFNVASFTDAPNTRDHDQHGEICVELELSSEPDDNVTSAPTFESPQGGSGDTFGFFDDDDLPFSFQTAIPDTLLDDVDDIIPVDDEDEILDSDAVDIIEGNSECEVDEADRKADTISRCENVILSVLSQLARALSEKNAALMESQSLTATRRIALELSQRRGPITPDENPGVRWVQFPAKSRVPRGKPLAQLLRVIDASHEALTDGISVTKRDIFYRDVSLFKTQGVVDVYAQLVDDLAATFNLGRADLNIRASAKGLFCGSDLTLTLRHGGRVVGDDRKTSLIPVGEDIVNIEVSGSLRWILIVEKEAIFQTLCNVGFASQPGLAGRGLIITGKGYPDLATRQLVKTLADCLPETIPILVLVDADAYGIDIASVYKYGSHAMRHERETLVATRVEWIGLSVRELDGLGVDRDTLLPMSTRDQKKALSMLRTRPNMPAEWRKELMYMIHNRRKAEIEVLQAMHPKTTFWQANAASTYGPSDNIDVLGGIPRRRLHPLMQYLSQKINDRLDWVL